MKIRADHRSAEVEPDPACEAEAMAAADTFRTSSLRVARALADVERKGIHLVAGYANVRDYAVGRLGLSGRFASALVAVGRQLDEPAPLQEWPGEAGRPGGASDAEGPTDAETSDHGTSDHGTSDHGTSDDGASTDDSQAGPDEPGTRDDGDGHGKSVPPAPTVEDRLRAGTLPLGNAEAFDRLVRALGGLRPEQRAYWTALAETSSEWRFSQFVRRAIEEAAQGAPTVPLRLQVTETARRDFQRARVLASRRAGTALTEGQVFAAMARHFVREQDKLEVGEKQRRTPHTKLQPGRRYTPAAVERAVLRRDEDRCSVGDCTNDTFLQLMHIRTPHALGGSREVDDLASGCTRHHLLHDAAVIRFVGFDERGKPVYRTRDGRLLLRSPSPDAVERPRATGPRATQRPRFAAAEP